METTCHCQAPAKHLGNHLSTKLDFSSFSTETKTDLLCKWAILFDKVHQVQQQFGYYDPKVILRLLSIYSTALYGSPLWQLYTEEHFKLNRSWTTAVKIILDLPQPTHTRFLESLCPTLSQYWLVDPLDFCKIWKTLRKVCWSFSSTLAQKIWVQSQARIWTSL